MKLVNEEKLTDRYLYLKDSIEPLEPEDFVRLKKSTYDKLQTKLSYPDNVFIIKSIDENNRSIEVYSLVDKLEINEVEPIPIDGIADKGIYYDPIPMAVAMEPLTNAPGLEKDYSYYMDGMKNSTDLDQKTYYDKVRLNNCQYVHEVQHLLRGEKKDDSLKLHYNIRN